MAHKEIQPTLRLKDTHKILQAVFNIGYEVELALVESIKKTDEEKTALNLSYMAVKYGQSLRTI